MLWSCGRITGYSFRAGLGSAGKRPASGDFRQDSLLPNTTRPTRRGSTDSSREADFSVVIGRIPKLFCRRFPGAGHVAKP